MEVGAGWGRQQTQQEGAAAAGQALQGREAPSANGGEGGRACFRARALDVRGEAHLSALRGSARAPAGAIARRRLGEFLALLSPKPDVASEDPLRCAG